MACTRGIQPIRHGGTGTQLSQQMSLQQVHSEFRENVNLVAASDTWLHARHVSLDLVNPPPLRSRAYANGKPCQVYKPVLCLPLRWVRFQWRSEPGFKLENLIQPQVGQPPIRRTRACRQEKEAQKC